MLNALAQALFWGVFRKLTVNPKNLKPNFGHKSQGIRVNIDFVQGLTFTRVTFIWRSAKIYEPNFISARNFGLEYFGMEFWHEKPARIPCQKIRLEMLFRHADVKTQVPRKSRPNKQPALTNVLYIFYKIIRISN